MPRPCLADHAPSPATCTLCGHCVRDNPESRALRQMWGEPEPERYVRPTLVSLPLRRLCRHLGEPTGETVACGTCGDKATRVKVYSCDLHSVAVLGHDVRGTHGCDDCPDHAPAMEVPEAGQVRNLLFHLYPMNNEVWRWHLQMLRQRAGLFNGKKICALVTDHLCADAAVVRAELATLFDEILEFPNDGALREVASFEPLFSRVWSWDRRHVTLYAHAKATSRPAHASCRRWAEVQYEVYLDEWPEVERHLREYPVVGAFKKIGRGFNANESASDWHYSGSWAWFRNRDLFGQSDWRRIDRFRFGIEPYWSLHFGLGESACIFHERPVPDMNLYADAYWRDTVEPEYAAWRASLRGVEGLKVELGGGEHPRGDGFINVDQCAMADVQLDLERDPLPFEGESVAAVYSSHTFEHLTNLHHVLHQIARVCKVGARVEIRVPHPLSAMAMCHGHRQIIPPEQVEHWTRTAIPYWWAGQPRRLRHLYTQQVPGGAFAEAKKLHPGWSEAQIMRFVPGAAHEIAYFFEVIPNAADPG